MANPTNIEIESGQIERNDSPHQAIILAHGGAGPQDPNKESYTVALERLEQVVANVNSHQPLGLSPILIGQWERSSLVEKLTLNGARALEADTLFNAGLGASLQGDGMARLSASFMESERRRFSAVINSLHIIHASELAWALQAKEHSVLDANGAERIKRELGMKIENPITGERLKKWIHFKKNELSHLGDGNGKTGTIGVVGIDEFGRLAAVTSTGGIGNEIPGRVGDSPTIAGNFCSTKVAVSCTGIGEQITSHAMAPRIAFSIENGIPLKTAMENALVEAGRSDYSFAAIALAKDVRGTWIEWAAGAVNCRLLWTLREVKA